MVDLLHHVPIAFDETVNHRGNPDRGSRRPMVQRSILVDVVLGETPLRHVN